MKTTTKLTAVAILAYFGLSAPAMAISIELVGPIDPLIGWTSLENSSEEMEHNWVEAFLIANGYAVPEEGVNNPEKFQTEDSNWYAVEDKGGATMIGVFALRLWTETDFYLLKTGEGSPLGTDFLFDNRADPSNPNGVHWAVFDMAAMGFDTQPILNELSASDEFNPGVFKVSHVSEFDLPEPSSLLLISLGLLGMAGIARRRKGVEHSEA